MFEQPLKKIVLYYMKPDLSGLSPMYPYILNLL